MCFEFTPNQSTNEQLEFTATVKVEPEAFRASVEAERQRQKQKHKKFTADGEVAEATDDNEDDGDVEGIDTVEVSFEFECNVFGALCVLRCAVLCCAAPSSSVVCVM
jgi:hypothetical protein